MEYHIGKYLTDVGVFSNNLFYNFQPDTDDLVATVYSESVPQTIDSHHFDTDHVGIHFLYRGINQASVYALAWQVHRELTALGSIEIDFNGDVRNIVDTHIVNAPVFLERDDKGRVVFTAHYHIRGNIGGNRFRQMDITLSPLNEILTDSEGEILTDETGAWLYV